MATKTKPAAEKVDRITCLVCGESSRHNGKTEAGLVATRRWRQAHAGATGHDQFRVDNAAKGA